jgi:hypothetical protein
VRRVNGRVRPPVAGPSYDSTAARRALVGQGRARGRALRAAAAAGEQALPASAWPDRGQEAIVACRVLAAYFTHHAGDPVAAALAAELDAWIPPQGGPA